MLIENLKIGRIPRSMKSSSGRTIAEGIAPVYADQLESWSEYVILKERVTEALSAQAKSIELQIVKCDETSHIANARDLIDSKDDRFLALSCDGSPFGRCATP